MHGRTFPRGTQIRPPGRGGRNMTVHLWAVAVVGRRGYVVCSRGLGPALLQERDNARKLREWTKSDEFQGHARSIALAQSIRGFIPPNFENVLEFSDPYFWFLQLVGEMSAQISPGAHNKPHHTTVTVSPLELAFVFFLHSLFCKNWKLSPGQLGLFAKQIPVLFFFVFPPTPGKLASH